MAYSNTLSTPGSQGPATVLLLHPYTRWPHSSNRNGYHGSNQVARRGFVGARCRRFEFMMLIMPRNPSCIASMAVQQWSLQIFCCYLVGIATETSREATRPPGPEIPTGGTYHRMDTFIWYTLPELTFPGS